MATNGASLARAVCLMTSLTVAFAAGLPKHSGPTIMPATLSSPGFSTAQQQQQEQQQLLPKSQQDPDHQPTLPEDQQPIQNPYVQYLNHQPQLSHELQQKQQGQHLQAQYRNFQQQQQQQRQHLQAHYPYPQPQQPQQQHFQPLYPNQQQQQQQHYQQYFQHIQAPYHQLQQMQQHQHHHQQQQQLQAQYHHPEQLQQQPFFHHHQQQQQQQQPQAQQQPTPPHQPQAEPHLSPASHTPLPPTGAGDNGFRRMILDTVNLDLNQDGCIAGKPEVEAFHYHVTRALAGTPNSKLRAHSIVHRADVNRDGRICWCDFITIYLHDRTNGGRHSFPFLVLPDTVLFSQLDINRDGRLSGTEKEKLVKAFATCLPLPKAQSIVNDMDATLNKDSSITVAEFSEYLKNPPPFQSKTLDQLAQNHASLLPRPLHHPPIPYPGQQQQQQPPPYQPQQQQEEQSNVIAPDENRVHHQLQPQPQPDQNELKEIPPTFNFGDAIKSGPLNDKFQHIAANKGQSFQQEEPNRQNNELPRFPAKNDVVTANSDVFKDPQTKLTKATLSP